MEKFLEGVYLMQLTEDCEMFLDSISEFNKALQNMNSDNSRDPFAHAMNAIQKAAAVSRMFWPPQSKGNKKSGRSGIRGEHLRAALEISDTHVIKSRTLRDHLEHFDERLDDWAENSKNKCIIKKLLGPRKAVGGVEDTDIIHHFDPAGTNYYFRGQPFDLQEITYGILDIQKKINIRQDFLRGQRSD